MTSWFRAGGALLICSAAMGALPNVSFAEDFEEGGKLYAVQNRKYLVTHEFALGLGTVPADAFYLGLTGNFSYTYHFDDLVAWEIANATYSLNVDKGLKRELMDNFGVRPTEFPELTFFVNSNFVWKPLYGKLVALNDELVYAELFLTGGPAVAQYDIAGVLIGLNAGIGLRWHLSKSFSLRFDFRDYFFVDPSSFSDTKNEIVLQAGISLNIR